MASLHTILALVDDLVRAASTDELCRRAVTLLSDRLGVERCSLWLMDGELARGTWGVDGRGGLTDERQQQIRPALPLPHTWSVAESDRMEAADGGVRSLGRGWMATTPVLTGERVVGLLLNDCAISQRPLDAGLQEALALFCSHLGPLLEQKRTDEALALREQQLRLVLEGANCAYWDLDLASGRSTFSAAFGAMLGYDALSGSADLALGEWMSYVHPDDQPLFESAISRHLTGEDARVDLVLRCMSRDGRPVWAEVVGQVVGRDEVGRACRLAGTLRDVSREQQARAALASSEKRLRAMVAALPDVVMVLGADGRLREPPTGAVEAMPMLSAGSPLDSHLPPGPAREFRAALAATLADGEPQSVALPWRHGARTTWFEARLARLGDDQVILVARDITARRQLEDQLRQVSKMEAVGVLAGGVAHEFNNLLTTIMGNAELLLEEVPAGHRSQAGLAQIVDSCQRAAELTQQLLGFGRKQVRRPQLIDLRHLLLRQRERIETVLGAGIDLCLDLPHGSVPVMADEPQVALVLANLAANARDAMPAGGQVTVSAAVSGDQAVLQVIDTGCGIPAELIERIFDPFFTTKGLGQGRGMSLAVVDGVVAQHGGSILVHSGVGAGTCFEVRLPLAAEPEDDSPPTAERAGAERPRTILLVESDPATRLASERILAECGYRVVAWSDPVQAAQWASDAKVAVDLLVTAAALPNYTGAELAELLRRIRPTLPVLLLGEASGETPWRAIARPISAEQLRRAVSEAVVQGAV